MKDIKSDDDLTDFFESENKKGLVGIRSNFRKGTTEVATFPNEIIKFFGKISILNTLGRRKSLISLMKQFDTTYLTFLEINGKVYSSQKKIFPLQLENI